MGDPAQRALLEHTRQQQVLSFGLANILTPWLLMFPRYAKIAPCSKTLLPPAWFALAMPVPPVPSFFLSRIVLQAQTETQTV